MPPRESFGMGPLGPRRILASGFGWRQCPISIAHIGDNWVAFPAGGIPIDTEEVAYQSTYNIGTRYYLKARLKHNSTYGEWFYTVGSGGLQKIGQGVRNYEDLTGKPKPKLRIGLVPKDTVLTGAGSDPELVHTNGTNFDYDELKFDKGATEECYFIIPGALTKNYIKGKVTIKLHWKGVLTTGDVLWWISLMGRGGGEEFDRSFSSESDFVSSVAGTTKYLVAKTIEINGDSLVAGDVWILMVRRWATQGTDTLNEDASFISISITQN